MKPQLNDPKKAQEYFAARMAFTAGPAELDLWIKDKERINIVDVRRAEDYAEGHIPGAASLPKEKWNAQDCLKKDRLNVFYCYSQQCHLAPEAALEFSKKGYPALELEGGFDAWRKYNLPTESLAGATA